MSDNKSLQVKKDGIIEKIFEFFRSIFSKSKNEQIEYSENNSISTFDESLKIKPKEKSKIEIIQNNFENGKIELDSLSDKEIHFLNLLYQSQILELEKILENKLQEMKLLKNKNLRQNN